MRTNVFFHLIKRIMTNDPELKAMSEVYDALQGLDGSTQQRVVDWVMTKLKSSSSRTGSTGAKRGPKPGAKRGPKPGKKRGRKPGSTKTAASAAAGTGAKRGPKPG